MSEQPSTPPVTSLADLFALAYQIEADAADRYRLLADQMEAHNNPELVKVFRDLARAEEIHAREIQQQAGDISPDDVARMRGEWKAGDSPEEADLYAAHYLMTPWHALQMALVNEKRAVAFFKDVADAATDAKIKQLATEFVEEEVEHVNLVHRLLRKYPEPAENWADDPDSPNAQE